MRFGIRFKAPRGWGWLTNPQRALYNRVYNRTTDGCVLPLLVFLGVVLWLVVGELGSR